MAILWPSSYYGVESFTFHKQTIKTPPRNRGCNFYSTTTTRTTKRFSNHQKNQGEKDDEDNSERSIIRLEESAPIIPIHSQNNNQRRNILKKLSTTTAMLSLFGGSSTGFLSLSPEAAAAAMDSSINSVQSQQRVGGLANKIRGILRNMVRAKPKLSSPWAK